MVSHDQKTWHVTILIDLAELDLGDILQFWDPNQHFGERMTENLNQTLHTDTAKTVRPAASPWVLLVLLILLPIREKYQLSEYHEIPSAVEMIFQIFSKNEQIFNYLRENH